MKVFARESQTLISTKNESISMVYFKLIVGYDAAFFIMKSYFPDVFYEPINSKEVRLRHYSERERTRIGHFRHFIIFVYYGASEMNLKSRKYFTGRILRDSGLGVEPAIS